MGDDLVFDRRILVRCKNAFADQLILASQGAGGNDLRSLGWPDAGQRGELGLAGPVEINEVVGFCRLRAGGS